MEACGHIPVDVSDIIPELIFTHLRKGHALTFKGRVVLARKDVLAQSPGFDLNLPDLM